MKRSSLCGKFQSINDFILRNWGACVDTIFGMSQNSQRRLIGSQEDAVSSW